ncbi:FMN-dependent NADH-azoreductase [Luteimonas pelagia]
MNILQLDSSILGDQSASRGLGAAIASRLVASTPGARLVHRDLAADPLPHLDGHALAKADPDAVARDEAVLREFLDADVVVVAAPMYNFSIPSQLKAWIDRIAVAGRTFRYTQDGPEGLAGGKRVIVAASYGGVHDATAGDFVAPYLRHLFGFLGVDTVEFVTAQGLAVSPEHRAAAIEGARGRIDALAALPLAA